MNRLLVSAIVLTFGATAGIAQSLDDLNIQIHGYATQGFLYSNQNNMFTTESTSGSPAWTDAVINITALPAPKLRVGVQGRYLLLGNYGNDLTLDWAAADYKANSWVGLRFGKVKTPSGLFNETQDIDPSHMWVLLPQGVYPLASRNSVLAHYGGVLYGSQEFSGGLGEIEYRAWGGQRVISPDDGYFTSYRTAGIILTTALTGPVYGGAIRWHTPVTGLMIGASDLRDEQWNAQLTDTIPGFGTFKGSFAMRPSNLPNYFARYEKRKVMVAGEYSRLLVAGPLTLPNVMTEIIRQDQRAWYVMASYKWTDKFTLGVYDSQDVDHEMQPGTGRYSKDWAVSSRYDFNEFLYAKAEQHFVDGTLLNSDISLNPGGLKPDSKLTVLKIGVSF